MLQDYIDYQNNDKSHPDKVHSDHKKNK